MFELSSSTSFQGVLDSIIRNYLLNELQPDGTENNSNTHQAAEKDIGFLGESGIKLPNGPQVSATNVEETAETPGTSRDVKRSIPSSANPSDLEYIKAVCLCFEKRGVFKELQTFLRHKLVSILEEEWPDLHLQAAASQNEGPNTTVHKLVEDFLRCRKLLYTFSVLASESPIKLQSSKVLHGKLSSKDAGDLLNEMGIQSSSRLGGQILKCYFDNDNFSLLESMHCLGVWPLESSDHLRIVDIGTEKRKGIAGESIVLNRCSQERAVQTTSLELKESREQENLIGVEQRLFELQRNFDREKEFKITEGIEKFKKSEQLKLREEMETKLKLQLIEKEKEHFLDTQRRMNEANAKIQNERMQWLEEKLQQENKLSECRKQLSELINVRGDEDNSLYPTALPKLLEASASLMTKPGESTSVDARAHHKCSCKKRQSSQHAHSTEMFSTSRQPTIAPIEQDRLAFLQYRMEQQDEEIETLKRQLVQTTQIPVVASKFIPTLSGNANVQTEAIPERHLKEIKHETGTSSSTNDLDTFLSASKARVVKLDNAVDKVDEIVQELLSKRRQSLSQQLSLEMMSAVANKNRQSLSQLHSCLQNMSTTPVPMLATPSNFSSAAPLIHQQIPEKQSACTSLSVRQTSPSYSTIYPKSDLVSRPRSNYQSPPIPVSLREKTNVVIKSNDDRPETPVDAIFEVAYGEPVKVARELKRKESLVATASLESKEKVANNVDQGISQEVQGQEESLFFRAAWGSSSSSSVELKSNKNVREGLEKKAIRHGALSREKMLSSDEEGRDDNSISVSRSLLGSHRQNGFHHHSTANSTLGDNDKNVAKALSKTKIYGTVVVKSVELPTNTKVDNVTPKKERVLDYPRQKDRSTSNSAASKSTSSSHNNHVSKASMSNVKIGRAPTISNREQPKHKERYDDEDPSSISISAPKSEGGDGDNEDFWQM